MTQPHPQLADGIAMQRQGDFNTAIDIYHSLLALDPDNYEALHYLGLVMLQVGKLDEADRLMQRSLQLNGQCLNTMSDLATVKLKNNQVEKALGLFGQVLSLNPNHTDALHNMGKALIKINQHQDALPLFAHLAKLRPRSVQAHFHLAETQYKLGDIYSAVENYGKAVKLDPDNRKNRLHLGEAFESIGKFKQAKMQYLSILRRAPNNPPALARLLQLGGDDSSDALLEQAKTVAGDENIKANIRAQLNYSIARHYDRNHKYDEAFEFLKKAKDEWFTHKTFMSDEFSTPVDRLITFFTAEFFNSNTESGHSSNLPIFIVGMPRSGTTLTEQILASHPKVTPGGELSMMLDLGRQVQQLSKTRRAYPEGLGDFGHSEFSTLARKYLVRLRQISDSAAHITDKLPFNFIHVGLIATLFPQAKIIHCHRNPLDNCLSCYFTSFNDQIQFANNLTVLGMYYLQYIRLMEHWQTVLSNRIFNVRYESLVENTEKEVLNLLKFCGLEWDDACLNFHKTERGVKTPSRWQVRQPINSKSVKRWLHYEKQLQPLLEILSTALPDLK